MVKVLDDAFGVEQGLMQTVHAYTGDQNLVDGPHKRPPPGPWRGDQHRAHLHRRGPGHERSCSTSMKGKLDGTSLRVPVPTGSIVDFTANLKKAATVDADQRRVQEGRASGPLKGILRVHRGPDRVERHRQPTRTAASSTPASR